ncbi:MAG: hypothetical protein IT355_12915 [Gemmatimonadaceae bacterium]|nr:hypothetical protein [Gemmatimonadaceae bacterium]
MIKKLASSLAVAVVLLAAPSQASAQVKLGYSDVGGVVGLGNIGSASISFGGRYERVFKSLPDLGDGLLGIGVSADVYSWSAGSASFRYIPIGATANYHFKIDPKKKLDAFLGAGLGFQVVSCDFPGSSIGCSGFNSGVYFIGRAGGRYFLTPRTSVYADAGAGAATLNVGLTIKLSK